MLSSRSGRRSRTRSSLVSLSFVPSSLLVGLLLLSSRAKLNPHYSAIFEHVTEQPRTPITVTLPDGSTREGISFETTPFALAQAISTQLSEKVVVAKVDGALWDVSRPLEKDCSLELMDFNHPSGEARAVFWHSSAHVLGEACERHLEGCCLGHGPPIDNGFFYDMKIDNERCVADCSQASRRVRDLMVLVFWSCDRVVAPSDWPNIETIVKGAVKEKQAFERVEMPKEALLEMFAVSLPLAWLRSS
jgi:threonyl-tRNA synthetase